MGDAVAAAAADHGWVIVRADANALYSRSNRLMRWTERCAVRCCGGWEVGEPRYRAIIVGEGRRIALRDDLVRSGLVEFKRALLASRGRVASAPFTFVYFGLDAAIVQRFANGCRSRPTTPHVRP